MDRPALKKLLGDIAVKRVDTIVVYKVDRLTRSLADFAKIVEQFEQQRRHLCVGHTTVQYHQLHGQTDT